MGDCLIGLENFRSTFILRVTDEVWVKAPTNQFVVFVWLGSPSKNEGPRYWITTKRNVGKFCVDHPAHGTTNWERRFALKNLKAEWENNWEVFNLYLASV
jgi:hypothetical protein